MRPTTEQRLEALRSRRAQIDAELSRLEAKTRAQNRKLDTRKKILVGAVVLNEMNLHQDFNEKIMGLLESQLKKNKDRAVLGFPPLVGTQEEGVGEQSA